MLDEQLQPLQDALAERYRFGRELGRGGWGVVYLAEDLKHQRPVAIKLLHLEQIARPARERFLREIGIASRLTHPHIVPLFDSGEAAGLLYYVMPYIAGETLQQRLRRERQLPIAEALRIAGDVASALGHAHQQGVVHRDIKPANILLSGEHALVADFGIARALSSAAADEWVSSAGVRVGTPEYMSPEQSSGDHKVDGRSDVYSLGCVLYEMLAGAPPFAGPTPLAVISRHSLDPPPPLRTVRPAVPESVEAAIRKALAKVPADRFATAEAFRAACHLPDGDTPVASAQPRRRSRIAWLVAAGLATPLAIGLWYTGSAEGGPAVRSWVLVSDFDAPSEDRSLGVAVRELVAAGLNQSRRVSVVPQEQIAAAMRDAAMPDSVALDSVVAREIAFRSSVRVIVTGRISRVGRDAYSIVLHAVDAETGENRFSGTTAVSDAGSEMIARVERLVRDLRSRLGERSAQIEATRPLIHARTPSFAAFRRYVDGVTAMRAGAYDRSTELLRDAVAIDSAFATAWASMAMNYVTARRPDSAAAAFGRALALTDRLSDADQHRLRGDVAFYLERDLETAVRAYDRYLVDEPTSVGGYNNRALYLSALGRHEDALRDFELAATIDPLRKGPQQIQLMNIAGELVVLGRIDSARATARQLTGAPAQYLELLLLNAADQWDSLGSRARDVIEAPRTERFVQLAARMHAIGALAARGSIQAANDSLRAAAARTAGPESRWYLQALMLLDLALDRAPGWSLPEATARDTAAGAVLVRGIHAALRRDTVSATAALRELLARDERQRRAVGFGTEYLAALVALAIDDPDSAQSLQAMAQRGEHDPFSLDRVSSLALRWVAARALAAAGRLDSAVSTLELVVRPTGLPPAHYTLRGLVVPFAHRQLAVWHEALGRRESAASHWRAFTSAMRARDSTTARLLSDPLRSSGAAAPSR